MTTVWRAVSMATPEPAALQPPSLPQNWKYVLFGFA